MQLTCEKSLVTGQVLREFVCIICGFVNWTRVYQYVFVCHGGNQKRIWRFSSCCLRGSFLFWFFTVDSAAFLSLHSTRLRYQFRSDLRRTVVTFYIFKQSPTKYTCFKYLNIQKVTGFFQGPLRKMLLMNVPWDVCLHVVCFVESDECKQQIDNCPANSTCIDTRESYTCACHDGFHKDGMNCTGTG